MLANRTRQQAAIQSLPFKRTRVAVVIGYSFEYCSAHGLPGYDAWKLASPDDDYEEPPEDDENWEDDAPDWWWETSYVDAADYDWNEARYVEWLESIYSQLSSQLSAPSAEIAK